MRAGKRHSAALVQQGHDRPTVLVWGDSDGMRDLAVLGTSNTINLADGAKANPAPLTHLACRDATMALHANLVSSMCAFGLEQIAQVSLGMEGSAFVSCRGKLLLKGRIGPLEFDTPTQIATPDHHCIMKAHCGTQSRS